MLCEAQTKDQCRQAPELIPRQAEMRLGSRNEMRLILGSSGEDNH